MDYEVIKRYLAVYKLNLLWYSINMKAIKWSTKRYDIRPTTEVKYLSHELDTQLLGRPRLYLDVSISGKKKYLCYSLGKWMQFYCGGQHYIEEGVLTEKLNALVKERQLIKI